jgi:hypothetical protein
MLWPPPYGSFLFTGCHRQVLLYNSCYPYSSSGAGLINGCSYLSAAALVGLLRGEVGAEIEGLNLVSAPVLAKDLHITVTVISIKGRVTLAPSTTAYLRSLMIV